MRIASSCWTTCSCPERAGPPSRLAFRGVTAPTAPTGRLRPIALGVIRRRDAILVFKGHDPSTGETFYRPLGGGIEFGEPVVEALRREIREELHVELGDVRYLGTLENLFVYDGRQGHEIVLVYEAMFADKSDYDRDLEGEDGDGGASKCTGRTSTTSRCLGRGFIRLAF